MIGKILALGAGALAAAWALPKIVAKVQGTPPVQSSSTAGDISSISPAPPAPAPAPAGPTPTASYNEATGQNTGSMGDPNYQGPTTASDTSSSASASDGTIGEIASLAQDTSAVVGLVGLVGL